MLHNKELASDDQKNSQPIQITEYTKIKQEKLYSGKKAKQVDRQIFIRNIKCVAHRFTQPSQQSQDQEWNIQKTSIEALFPMVR